MNKLFITGFVVFASVFAGLLFLEATGGLISESFPIALWFWLTVAFGVAAIATLPKAQGSTLWSWSAIVLCGLFTLLLTTYAVVNAWRFGPFGILLVLVALILPVVFLRVARE